MCDIVEKSSRERVPRILLLLQLYFRNDAYHILQGVSTNGSFFSAREKKRARPQKLRRFNFHRDKSPTGTHDPV